MSAFIGDWQASVRVRTAGSGPQYHTWYEWEVVPYPRLPHSQGIEGRADTLEQALAAAKRAAGKMQRFPPGP